MNSIYISPLTSHISLPVMEHFYTVQGEGAYTGHAAYFIRLGGCDVGCHWCDVKESWPMDTHPKMTIQQIIDEASQYPGRIVVITGGEPLMHDLTNLTTAFKVAGFRTHIETSGAHPLSGHWDWICLSPKKFKEPLAEIFNAAHELKAIIFNKSDFEFAEQNNSKLNTKNSKLYLQPEWSKREEMMPLIVDYVKSHPQWQISLQTHKYLNIP
jgi:7-carboxy-7-deazaguanine synthase